MGLKRAIKEKLGIKPHIGWGSLGQLDVFADGQLIFSYQQAGHMPEDDEILKLLESRLAVR